MVELVFILVFLLDIFLWMVIGSVLISWLVVFNVLNTRNKWVQKLCYWLDRITNPVMAKIRNFIPPLGGMDLSPIVVIFGINIIQNILVQGLL